MSEYETARRDYGTAVALQDWHAAMAALETMVRHRPTDDVLHYLHSEVDAVRSRLKRGFWAKLAGVPGVKR